MIFSVKTQTFRGGAFLAGGAIIQAIVGLAAQLVLMRLLFPEAFGEFVTLMAGCSLVQTVLSLRLNVLIIRASDDDLEDGKGALYRAALIWESVIATVITLAWVASIGLMSGYALTLVASLALGHWTNQSAAFYERKMAYPRIVAVETGSQIAGHGLAVALIFAGAGAASLYAREMAVTLSRLWAFSRLGALPSPSWRMPNVADLRLLFAEARGLWADGLLEGGFSRIVILASAGLGGAHGAGILSQTLRLALIPHQLMSPMVVRLSANLFARTTDPLARSRLLLQLTSVTLIILVAVAGIALWLAEPLIPSVLGEQWRPVVSVIEAMAGVIVFFSAFELLRAYCMTRQRMDLLMVARAVQYVVFVLGAALSVGVAEDIPTALGLALSSAYAAAFAALAIGLVRAGAFAGRDHAG